MSESLDRYFIRLNLDDSRIIWEEVDETVYKHRAEALDNEGNPRYECDDCVILNTVEGMVNLKYAGALAGLSLLMRMLGVKPFDGKSDTPIWDTPTHIKFRSRLGALWMYELETQTKFKISKKAS